MCALENWASSVTSRVNAMTFNVFASDQRDGQKRMNLISELLVRADPTFIALQEVEDWFFRELQQQSWIKKYYQTDLGIGHAPGGLIILSKYPFSRVTFFEASNPNSESLHSSGASPNNVLVASVNVDGRPLTLGTVALDWRDAKARAETLDYAFSVMNQFPDVVLLGDFNFDDQAQPESGHLSADYVDVWPSLKPHLPGFTWDPVSNAYARFSDPKSNPSRIDRIFVKSPQWLPRSISLIGCTADLLCTRHVANADITATALLQQQEGHLRDDMSHLQYPSNHYGLLVHLSRFVPHC